MMAGVMCSQLLPFRSPVPKGPRALREVRLPSLGVLHGVATRREMEGAKPINKLGKQENMRKHHWEIISLPILAKYTKTYKRPRPLKIYVM